MRKKFRLKKLIILIVVIGIAIGSYVALTMLPDGTAYTELIKEGYVSGRNIDQVMFFYPGEIDADKYLTEYHETDIDYGVTVELFNEEEYAIIDPEEYVLYVKKAELPEKEEVQAKDYFDQIEKIMKLRIIDYNTAVTEKKDGTEKTILNVAVQGLFSQDVYSDLTGKLAIIKKENNVCYLFVGNGKNGKIKENDMDYMAKSLHYIDYRTYLNSGGTVSEINTELSINEQNEIAIGTYGYANVINKADTPMMIKIAAKVDSVSMDAREQISAGLKRTPYSILPEPKEGCTWNVAKVTYSYLNHDVQEVLPYLNVKVQYGENIERVFLLDETMDGKLFTMEVFYEAPEEHNLLLGEKALDTEKMLTVKVDRKSIEEARSAEIPAEETTENGENVIEESEPAI